MRKSFVAVLALLLACGLVACGTIGVNDEDVIREGISEELDLLKDPTEENLGKYLESAGEQDLGGLEEYGIDATEVLGHMLAKFDYEIGDIRVEGDTAVADVTVSNVDIPAALQEAVGSMSDDDRSAELLELYEAGDEQAYMRQIFAYLFESIDASEDIVTTETQLSLTKKDSAWSIDQDGLEELISAVYGGVDMGGM